MNDNLKDTQDPSEENGVPVMRLVIAGTLVAVLSVGAAAMLDLPSFDEFLQGLQGASTAGSLATALDGADKEQPSEELDREPKAQARPVYEGPTSAYIEEGADSDFLDLSFADSGPEERSGPRTLSQRAIQQVINRHQRELLSCYGEELQNDPDLAGDVDFEFAIDPTGRVIMAKVAGSSLRSKAAEDCFVERARHWDFPETSGEIPTRFQTSMTFQL